MRILYLPHGRQRKRFDGLLAAAKDRRGWSVGVLAPTASRPAYPYVDDAHFFALPNFLDDAKRGVGSDAATAALIGDAEKLTGIPAGRIVLSGERDIGRGFGRPFYHLPERDVAGAVVADNTLPGRIVGAMFARMAEIIVGFEPNIVLAGNVAEPHDLALAMIARLRGIPVLIGRPSKVHADRCFWTQDLAMLNDAIDGVASGNILPAEMESEYIAEFRSRPRTIAYIARTWRDGAAEGWLKRHRYLAELIYLELKHKLLRRGGASPKPAWPSIVEYYRSAWLARRQHRFFVRPASDELAKLRYVYLALHKEPELAINYQAFAWHNQYETAARLAASLPFGVKLIVREHRFNRGRRPHRFYADLAALPNTTIADPFDDQFKYITNAAVIVTDNGSTGWEGLLLQRPVITLDRTFYDAAGLAHPVREPAQLGEMLLRLLNSPYARPADADTRLAQFIAVEFATTLPDGEEGLEDSLASIERAGSDRTNRASRVAASG